MNILWIENNVYYFLKKYENKNIDKFLTVFINIKIYTASFSFPQLFLSLVTDF